MTVLNVQGNIINMSQILYISKLYMNRKTPATSVCFDIVLKGNYVITMDYYPTLNEETGEYESYETLSNNVLKIKEKAVSDWVSYLIDTTYD